MSGITKKQLEDLLETTLKYIPKIPLINLLFADFRTDEEAKIIAQFMKKNYTDEEIEKALKQFDKTLKNLPNLYEKFK